MHSVTDADETERNVMTSLPRSRPARRSAKRGERPAGAGPGATNGVGATAADLAPATTKPKPKAAAKPKPKPKAAAKPKPKAAAKPKPKPKAAASSAAAPGASTTARREPRTRPRPKPAAVQAPAAAAAAGADAAAAAQPPPEAPRRKVPPAGYAAPSERPGESASPLTELVTTTVLAAGELAQIGLDVGRSALRSMLDRLPKP